MMSVALAAVSDLLRVCLDLDLDLDLGLDRDLRMQNNYPPRVG